MSTIVLSSTSSCRRQEIAERVARELGCDCLGPEVEAMAASRAGVQQDRVQQALSFSASPLSLLPSAREKYLAHFQAALVSALVRGNVLYHGDVGHMYVPQVSHILRVRLTADLEGRALRRVEAEGISLARARELTLKEDVQRTKWYRKGFDVDESDPALFDLVVDVSQHGVDGACRIIEETAREVRFQPVTYSLKSLHDHELAFRIRATLMEEFGPVVVRSKDGEVTVRSKALSKTRKAEAIRHRLLGMEGVLYVVFEQPR